MKTLIVDDEFAHRLLLQEALKDYGAVDVAGDGRAALEAVRAAIVAGQPYDLICLDIVMPEMDGQETLKEIRRSEETAGIPLAHCAKIIMTTALNDKQNVIHAYGELCHAYMVKPIRKDSLLKHLRDLELIE